MSDLRDRSFRTVIRGVDPEAVRRLLDLTAADYEAVQTEIAALRRKCANVLREAEQAAELERSLIRSLLAAEEEARIRLGAARRHGAGLIAAAEEKAAALLTEQEHERETAARALSRAAAWRQRAAQTLHALLTAIETDAELALVLVTPHLSQAARDAKAAGSSIEILDRNRLSAPRDVSVSGQPPPPAAPPEIHSPIETFRSETQPAGNTLQVSAAAGPPAAGRTPDFSADAQAPWLAPPFDEAAERDSQSAAIDDLSARSADRRHWYRRASVAATAGTAAAAALVALAWPASMQVRKPIATAAAASVLPALALPQPEPAAPASDYAVASTGFQPMGTRLQQPVPFVVRLKTVRPCWVRVVADGESDSRLLHENEDIVLKAYREVRLRVGDASALLVEVNGRALPPLGRAGEVVDKRIVPDQPPD